LLASSKTDPASTFHNVRSAKSRAPGRADEVIE